MGLVTRLVTVPVVSVVLLLVAGCSSATPADAAPRVTLPPPAGVFDYQLGGSYPPVAAVRIVDRDRTARPVRGRYNVCYVNAFQTQPDEARFWTTKHRTLLLRDRGKYVQDPDWPGEYLLDVSTAAKRRALITIVGRWIDGCARSGFRAVEPDNLDSYSRRGVGGRITPADDIAFFRLLAQRAHARGLAIGQKNTVEHTRAVRQAGADFAVAEECEVYRECGAYVRTYGKRVLEVEYTDTPRSAYTRACAQRHGRMSIILRDRDVVARGHQGYVYRHC